jgi:hypothetical protein
MKLALADGRIRHGEGSFNCVPTSVEQAASAASGLSYYESPQPSYSFRNISVRKIAN